MANNMDAHFNLEPHERASYVGKILKGIIDEYTVRKNIPKEFRKPYGFLDQCPLCNKKKIRDMKRHFKQTHLTKEADGLS